MMELPCVQLMARIRFSLPPWLPLAQSLVVALGRARFGNSRQLPHLPHNSELRQVQLATFAAP